MFIKDFFDVGILLCAKHCVINGIESLGIRPEACILDFMRPLFICFVFLVFPAQAHEIHGSETRHAVLIPAGIEKNIVQITEDETYRYIKGNGVPNHKTGVFPNRGNPNSISAQSHNYRVSLTPQKTGGPVKHNGVIGVALNGVPFEPGTAECYGRARGERGPMSSCEWREEAIVNGEGQLGLDSSNAHVQPTGAYHYHGMPHGFLSVLSGAEMVHVGYAADGFKIYVNRSGTYKPSYKLKSGKRSSGPGGRYDGKYTADYVYAASKVGNLDECNGAYAEEIGEYVYFITDAFPFAPRCLMGTADKSFARKGPGGGRNGGGPPPLGHRPPPRPY